MKSVILLYNTSCIFEIVTLNYFLNFAERDVIFASIDGKSIMATEGYSINVSKSVEDIMSMEIELLVVPGGDVAEIDKPSVYKLIKNVNKQGGIVAGICAGVDVLKNAGVLEQVKSINSMDKDVVLDKNIITSRANSHIDFAIEVAKKMNIFENEDDVKETIEFWKEHKGV